MLASNKVIQNRMQKETSSHDVASQLLLASCSTCVALKAHSRSQLRQPRPGKCCHAERYSPCSCKISQSKMIACVARSRDRSGSEAW